jgi:hypothetical protein
MPANQAGSANFHFSPDCCGQPSFQGKNALIGRVAAGTRAASTC